MNPSFYLTLFFRYLHRFQKTGSIVLYALVIPLGFLTLIPLFDLVIHGSHPKILPSFGWSMHHAQEALYVSLSTTFLCFVLALRNYFTGVIKNQTFDSSKWQIEVYFSRLEKQCMWAGPVGFVFACIIVVFCHILSSTLWIILQKFKQAFYNVRHMREVMEERNRKFLEEHPEKMATIMRLTLSKASTESRKKHL